MGEQVRQMFASIADRYDLVNSVLSMGTHYHWRKVAVRVSGAAKGMSVLDCATGTGDLAISFKKKVGESGYVLGTDFCREMIEPAPAKAGRHRVEVDFEVADAMDLPYQDDRFDISSIAFGIRNVDDPEQCLKEMARVVRPGGRVIVLEFGQPQGLIKYPYRFYSKHVIPVVGGLLTGNREAYTYLPETSARFPAGEQFLELMGKTGRFSGQTMKSLTHGIAYVYCGVVH